MPAPNKEYRCLAHGVFESRSRTQPKCPHGCSSVERIFLTPPMIATNRAQTQQQDGLQQMLASRYGLSNLKSAEPGQSMIQAMAPPGSSQPFEKPKSVEESMGLLQRGINPGTHFVPLNDKIVARDGKIYADDLKAGVPHHEPRALAEAAKNAVIPDDAAHEQGARLALQKRVVVNRPNPHDKDDFSKAMGLERPGATG